MGNTWLYKEIGFRNRRNTGNDIQNTTRVWTNLDLMEFIQMYRTDLQGTLILHSDGDSIWSDQDPCQDWTPGSYDGQTRTIPVNDGTGQEDSDQASGETSEVIRYVCNTNTKKFHYPSCDSVKQMNESNRMNTNQSRDELIAQGYQPCGNCRP